MPQLWEGPADRRYHIARDSEQFCDLDPAAAVGVWEYETFTDLLGKMDGMIVTLSQVLRLVDNSSDGYNQVFCPGCRAEALKWARLEEAFWLIGAR